MATFTEERNPGEERESLCREFMNSAWVSMCSEAERRVLAYLCEADRPVEIHLLIERYLAGARVDAVLAKYKKEVPGPLKAIVSIGRLLKLAGEQMASMLRDRDYDYDGYYLMMLELDGASYIKLAQSSPAKVRSSKIFLCHSSGDKNIVRKLYDQLKLIGVQLWLDEVDLLPGQDWEFEIRKAVRAADIMLICLSQSSTGKKGFVQSEIEFALYVAGQKTQGSTYIIPARLEPCAIPDRLSKWHCVDLFSDGGFSKLVNTIRKQIETRNE